MTIKLGPSTNPITSMFTTELHVRKQQHTPRANQNFHVSLNISNTLVDMYMKHVDFDGPTCSHVFTCL